MIGFGVASDLKSALQVRVQMKHPGHDTAVAAEHAAATGGDKQAVARLDGAGRAGNGHLCTNDEVAVAVVIEAGRNVIRLIARGVEVTAERRTWNSAA